MSPLFGPISGRTLVELKGQHLDAGGNTNVKVAGSSCDQIVRKMSTLECRVVKSHQLSPSPRCGLVEVTIDSFHLKVNKELQFCLRADPQVVKVSPRHLIESGGITVTIFGSHLDSVTSSDLVLNTTNAFNETLMKTYSSHCELTYGSTEIMTCQSPSVVLEDLDETESNDDATEKKGNYATFGMELMLDGRDVLADTPTVDITAENGTVDLPRTIRVYKDPTILPFIPGTEHAHKDVSEPILVIRVEQFPVEIPFSDIKISLGNWSCPVTKLTNDKIMCRADQAIRGFFEMTKLITTATTPSPKNTTTTTATAGHVETTATDDNDNKTREEDRPQNLLRGDSTSISRKARFAITNWFKNSYWKDSSYVKSKVNLIQQTRRQKRSSGFPPHFAPSKGREYTAEAETPLNLLAINRDDSGTNSTDQDKEPDEEGKEDEFSIDVDVEIKIGLFQQNIGSIILANYPYKHAITPAPTTTGGGRGNTGKDVKDDSSSNLRKVIGAAVAGAFVLLGAAAIVLCCQLVKTRRRNKEISKMAPYYMGSLSAASGSKEAFIPSLKEILESIIEPKEKSEVDNLIIDLDRLTVGKSVGSGNFGCVYEGLLTSLDGQSPQKVAVKTLQDTASQSLDLKSFVQEAVLMKDFRHPHVLGLVGLAERAGPDPVAPYVILPYMDNGDLHTYVRNSAVSISLHDVIRFGIDIASGMTYLSALKFVHRDLAARNCMLDSSYRAKVADFGLCRDIYEKGYYTSDNRKKLPIRWMAVESIEHGAYSTKSDVWSFGVVLWEMACRGVTPYPGVDGWDVINFLRTRRLAPPFFCPDELYNIMMRCWAKDPDKRPGFKTLQEDLLALLGQAVTIESPVVQSRGDKPKTPTTPTPAPRTSIVKLPPVVGPASKRALAMEQSGETPSDLQEPRRRSSHERNATSKIVLTMEGEAELRKTVKEAGKRAYNGPDLVVTSPPKVIVKNVMITIPACFAHRDLSRSEAAEYIQLVDNYEPAPKFSDHFLKTKFRISKKKSSGDKNSSRHRGEKPPVAPRSSRSRANDYSYPVECTSFTTRKGSTTVTVHQPLDHTDATSRNSNVSGAMMRHLPITRGEGNYFELETGRVASTASDLGSWAGRKSGRSSAMTGSIASQLGSRMSDRASSSASANRASGVSSRASSRASTPAPLAVRNPTGIRNGSNTARFLPVTERAVDPHHETGYNSRLEVDEPSCLDVSDIDCEISSCFDTEL